MTQSDLIFTEGILIVLGILLFVQIAIFTKQQCEAYWKKYADNFYTFHKNPNSKLKQEKIYVTKNSSKDSH